MAYATCFASWATLILLIFLIIALILVGIWGYNEYLYFQGIYQSWQQQFNDIQRNVQQIRSEISSSINTYQNRQNISELQNIADQIDTNTNQILEGINDRSLSFSDALAKLSQIKSLTQLIR